MGQEAYNAVTAYVGKWHLASDRLPGIGTHCEATPVPKEKQGEYRYWQIGRAHV